MTVPPYTPYVFARPQYGALGFPQVQSKVFRTSSLAPRLKAFNVKAVSREKSARVLLYNGSGGFGDQILTWPISKILNDYGFEVYILSDPGNEICWHLFPWVRGIYSLPVQFETLRLFEHHAFYEVVVNTDDHPDQLHPVDSMLHQMGFDLGEVGPEAKRVRPYFSAVELDEANALFSGKEIAIYQMHTGSPNRSLTPSESANTLRALAESFPHLTWIALNDSLAGEPYKKAMMRKTIPTNVELFRTQKIRVLWALSQRSKVVVAPDSMMAHIAGSLSVPCVGLWGVTSPESRVKYYENHFPIWKRQACQFSPCFSYLPDFPRYCPPFPEKRTQCEVMTSMLTSEIVNEVDKALSS